MGKKQGKRHAHPELHQAQLTNHESIEFWKNIIWLSNLNRAQSEVIEPNIVLSIEVMGHATLKCHNMKNAIEELVQKGMLDKFINKDNKKP